MMRLLAAPIVCAALALTGCSGTDDSSAEEASEPSATSSSAVPERPEVGECHRLSARELLSAADTQPAVDCKDKHTTETAYVGTFKAAVLTEPNALTGERANRRSAQTCRREAASYLGTDRGRMLLTRAEVFWFVPTPEEVDAGADWLRCDVVVLERDEELMALPRSMKGALQGQRGLERFGLCGTARPGAESFSRVTCNQQHSWRAIATFGIEGGDRFPGAQAVRSQGEERCQGLARAAQDDALQYDYGWEWPTKAQWEAGQRHGYCWAPA